MARIDMPESAVAHPDLADEGDRSIEWVRRNMPILRGLEERFGTERPFEGLRIAVSVHLEAKTAYLALVLAAGGATVSVCGSNPLSTKDAVVAALARRGLYVYARHGADGDEFRSHQLTALRITPHIVIDDGGDLVHHLHEDASTYADGIIGACEETTAGVIRNRARERAGRLSFPVVAVNDARMKHLFDNRYGTGQSTIDALLRTTNLLVAGRVLVVAGYGWCGRGVAARAAGMGARVIVCEVDEYAALEAVMDGYEVLPMDEAAKVGAIFVTTTGVRDVITFDHIRSMGDGALLANAGHFYDEIAVDALRAEAAERVAAKPNLTSYRLDDGRWINVIADGKIVNIAAADGHPAEIMDTSFAVQALSAELLARSGRSLEPGVHRVPDDIDRSVARLQLSALGIRHDTLSDAQRAYLEDFEK
jgi:adenosylhomocysteinase